MFCSQCGAKLAGDVKFCTKCGTKLASAPSEVSGVGLKASSVPATPTQSIPSTGHSASGVESATRRESLPIGRGVKIFAAVTLGGLGLLIVAIMVSDFVRTDGSSNSSEAMSTTPTLTSQYSAVESSLRAQALKELHESKYSTAASGLCDGGVANASLADVRIGTISTTDFTGDLKTPLPAIVARHDYICISNVRGAREHIADQWVILAIDAEFNMVRCVRTGYKDAIDGLIEQCKFRDKS